MEEGNPMNVHVDETILNLLATADGKRFRTILADPPWRFANRTGAAPVAARFLSSQ